MRVLSGIDLTEADGNPHLVESNDGQTALWLGAIDGTFKKPPQI
ncbi:MAG: hypothetical protein ACJAVK_003585 [Akkermansiaceae bacterium]|jgi:hypothetical protein